MAKATVLDVGNCDPDHSTMHAMLTEAFDVSVDRVMFVPQALKRMRENRYDLVLVNRKIFADGSPGMALLQTAKGDATLSGVPIMLISNFDEAQAESVSTGGVPGFGKDSIFEATTRTLLSQYLPQK